MGHMSNMSSLAACSVTDSKPMQFPLAQRRKRRVLFTQAQVRPKEPTESIDRGRREWRKGVESTWTWIICEALGVLTNIRLEK